MGLYKKLIICYTSAFLSISCTLYKKESGRKIQSYTPSNTQICEAKNSDQKIIASYCSKNSLVAIATKNHSERSTVSIKDLSTGNILSEKEFPWVRRLQFSPDCSKIFIGQGNSTVWDIKNDNIKLFDHHGPFGESYSHDQLWINNSVILFTDSELSAFKTVNTINGQIQKIDMGFGQIRRVQKSHNKYGFYATVYSSDTLGPDQKGHAGMKLYRIFQKDGKWQHELALKTTAFQSQNYFDQTENFLIVEEHKGENFWSFNGTINIYDKKSNKIIDSFIGLNPIVYGQKIVFLKGIGTSEKNIFVYDIATKTIGKINDENFPTQSYNLIKGSNHTDLLLASEAPFYNKSLYNLTSSFELAPIKIQAGLPSHHIELERVELSEKQTGYLYSPKAKDIKGGIIYLHGGMFNSEGSLNPFRDRNRSIYKLVSEGYLVLAISYAGDFDYTRNDHSRYFGTDEVKDIWNAYDHLMTKQDTKKIFLWGFSHGSSLSNFVAGNYSDIFNWSGIISHSGVWGYDRSNHSYLNKMYRNKNSCFLRNQEAIESIAKITDRVLLINGLQDTNSPYSTTDQFIKKSLKHNLQVESYIMEDEGHGIFKCSTWNTYIDHLLTYLDSSPETSTQWNTRRISAYEKLNNRIEAIVKNTQKCTP